MFTTLALSLFMSLAPALNPREPAAEPPFAGDLYVVEDRSHAQSVELSASYITNLSDSFVNSHGLQLDAQVFPFPFVGFGAAFMVPQSDVNTVGQGLIDLQKADIQSEILTTDWAGHFLVTFLPFVGRWNFFNLLQTRGKVSLQMGGGVLALRDLISNRQTKMLSYFWRITHSLEISRPVAFVIGVGGDRLDYYLNLGLQIELPLSKDSGQLAEF